MLLKRALSPFDMPRREGFRGPLDIRAPEDQFVSDEAMDDDAPVWSEGIRNALINWDTAKRSLKPEEQKRAANEVVAATAAHFNMSGVPAFAHHPLPPQLVAAELEDARGVPEHDRAGLVDRLVDLFDDSTKPAVKQQIMRYLDRAQGSEQKVAGPVAEVADGAAPSVLRSLLNSQNPPRLIDRTWRCARAWTLKATTWRWRIVDLCHLVQV
jgi:hypothetical protein